MLSHTTRRRLSLFRKQPSRRCRDKISAYTANHASHSFLASPPPLWRVFASLAVRVVGGWVGGDPISERFLLTLPASQPASERNCTNYLERRLIKAINWGPLDKRGECNSKSGRFAQSPTTIGFIFSWRPSGIPRALDGVSARRFASLSSLGNKQTPNKMKDKSIKAIKNLAKIRPGWFISCAPFGVSAFWPLVYVWIFDLSQRRKICIRSTLAGVRSRYQ